MALSNWTKFWLTELLTFCYFLIVGIVALLNTATWLTERPFEKLYHQPGLYALVKGFNTFFGMTVLVAIVFIAYAIGNRILLIADLRVRANYNFYLFVFSTFAIVFIPAIYMILRYLHMFTISSGWNCLYLLTLSTFLALNAFIFFVLAIFLLLTALMCTLRSYNVFKYLVKLRRLHKLAPPPKKSAMRQTGTQPTKANVGFRKPPLAAGQPLPTVIGRVPRKYRYDRQRYQQHIQQPQYLRPGTPTGHYGRMTNPMMIHPRFGSRTPSIPSTSWQSFYSSAGSSAASSPRVIILGQPPHMRGYNYIRRPTPPQPPIAKQPFML